ncbi:hypothetical protein B0A50_00921 [Salinomyces thailandicus]|uniref:TLC domain-containing protein n=1 Tax=Salinomyces thailandicus TaxID=706561 RepID=A0A4U0UD07_9PEZI|nr:hypothetical protein B0A50_00921 [Salinomyces thailandica]
MTTREAFNIHPLGLAGIVAATYSALLTALRSLRKKSDEEDPRIDLHIVTDIHSILSSAAVLYSITQPWDVHHGAHGSYDPARLDDRRNPLIHGKSALANAITTWEAGFLIYDTLATAFLRYSRRHDSSRLKSLLRFARVEPLTFTHHVALVAFLGTFQIYIAQGRERGVRVLNNFNLMNLSTPILHWRWLRRHRTGKTDFGLDVLLAVVFAACRMGSIVWVLSDYGHFHGIGAWEAFVRQRWFCQLGTGALFVMNTSWWALLVKGIVKGFRKKTQKVA